MTLYYILTLWQYMSYIVGKYSYRFCEMDIYYWTKIIIGDSIMKGRKKRNEGFEVVQIPGEIDSELLESTVDFASLIRWGFMTSYFLGNQVLANPYQDISNKAPAFNLIVMTLRSLVMPLADEEFEERMTKLYENYKKVYGEKYWTVPSYGIAILEEIIQLLHRQDILTVRHGVLDIIAEVKPLLEEESDGKG